MEFLGNFKVRKEEGSDEFIDIYGDQAHTMVQNERQTMFINLKHIKEFDGQLSAIIDAEYYQYEIYLLKGLQ